jgi:flagellar FliL protein
MSTAATADHAGDAAPKKGKKKLIIILAAVLVLVAGGGGAAVVMMKKKAAAEAAAAEEDGEDAPVAEKAKAKSHDDHKTPPTFVPLEAFVVNLADKETDRYAQIGITLEVDDPKFADQLKAYMPAIRSGILMVLSHKTSQQLLQPEGKIALANEIMRESVLPLGIEIEDEDAEVDDAPKKKKKKKKAAVHNPVTHVHFSNFIVQ